MLNEAFLICAMSLPSPMHNGRHLITHDDAKVFYELTQPIRTPVHKPTILFAYNYYETAEHLRSMGLRAYSMTLELSGGHFRGHLLNLPFAPGSLGVVVILQKLVYAELFEAMDPVQIGGAFLIKDKNLPFLAEVVLRGMGFKRLDLFWHEHRVFRRVSAHEYKKGTGFDAFNAKPVQDPKIIIHRDGRRGLLGSA